MYCGVTRDLSELRVLLVHEWIYTWAGGERVLEELMVMIPHAHVLTGIVTPRMRQTNAIAARAEESWVGRLPGSRTKHRWFLPLHALAFATYDTREYDLVISVSHAFEKAIRPRGGTTHVCYCLSPPRYLWDLRDTHERLATIPQRMALRAGGSLLRAVDRWAAGGVHRFGSISRYVADRVRRTYGRNSDVVYPPVRASTDPLPRDREPFLLSFGRLVPYKRVDLAIRAAEQLGMRLVVAGDGPERANLERIAGPFIDFRGHVSDAEATNLLRSCAALVFCAEEDFGIAPLEGHANGAPVVAFDRGAAAETLRADGRELASFFGRQEPAAVADAITRCLSARWDSAELRANAARFSPARFREGIEMLVGRALDGRR